jgi:serine/threonine-protein kinase
MPGAGDKVGGFSLVRQLGAGGMGETWEAVRRRDHGFEQRVAIKLASRNLLATKEGLELFRREASLAASLRHPNIAAVLDVDETQGYLIYELIDGADLRAVLREAQGRPPTQLIVYVVAQIARGLAHAHRRVLHGKLSPVVHRDMSPGNVVVDYDGNVKIVDFGIAKATALGERSESIKGKLAYMSPEQITGGTVDGRVDQYSLGVMAYEAVAGARPNDGSHDGETLAKILHGDHIPITRRVPEIPAGLGETIERMIAVKPDDRFESMDALIDALVPFNPPLTIHRELAALVFRANPPQTIMLKNGTFVSVPVSLTEARASQPPTRSMPRPAHLGLPQNVATESLVRAEPLSPRSNIDSDIGRARTLLAEERSPGATALPLEVARTPGPADDLGKRSRFPLYALTAAISIGLISWAALSGPFAFGEPQTPGMNAAEIRDESAPTLAAAASPPPVAQLAPAAAPRSSPTPSQLDPMPSTASSSAPANAAAPSPAAVPAANTSDTARATADSKSSTKTGRARKQEKREREQPAAAPAMGKVRIKVFPWGRIWIDGKERGSAPPIFVAELSAGAHEIAAGHEKPMETKKITLEVDQEKVVLFDLEERP